MSKLLLLTSALILWSFEAAAIMAIKSNSHNLTFNKFMTIVFRDHINELIVFPILILYLFFYADLIQGLLCKVSKQINNKDKRIGELEEEVRMLKELANRSRKICEAKSVGVDKF